MTIDINVGESKFEYKLTVSEMREAYYEYEHICDVEDVKSEIRQRCSEFTSPNFKPLPTKWLKAHIDEIAYLKRKYIDNYDSDWNTATNDAIDDYIADHYTGEE